MDVESGSSWNFYEISKNDFLYNDETLFSLLPVDSHVLFRDQIVFSTPFRFIWKGAGGMSYEFIP